MAVFDQLASDGRADKARGASDEDEHDCMCLSDEGMEWWELDMAVTETVVRRVSALE